MRLTVAMGLGLVIVGCATETPTSSDSGLASIVSPGAALAGPAGSDIVLVDVWQRGRDGSDVNQQQRLVVEQSLDGVSVSSLDTSVAPPTRLRPSGSAIPNRSRIARSALSVWEGAQLYDAAGLPVKRPDLRALREESGLPAVSSRPTPGRGGRPAWNGPRRYVTRLVTAERAERQLQDLRAHSEGEGRVGSTQLRFTRTEGDVTQSWVFDEAIGAVIEAIVERGGKRHLLIQNEYQRRPDGYVLMGSVSQWFSADGQVTRRAAPRFLGQ